MILRHGEKPPDDGPPHGIDADGDKSEHSLTTTGWARAGALVELFASARSAPPAGLLRPGRLYASQGDSKSRRPLETLTPLAARLGLTVDTSHAKADTAALAADLRAAGGVALVSWEHDAIPAIALALGTVTPPPPSEWPDDRFDLVWVLAANGAGWTFAQVPQQLLAGDSADVIR